MERKLASRFWVEAGLALSSGLLLALTLAWPQWIEGVFGVDPDRGRGAAEAGTVAALLVVTLVAVIAARADWRIAAARHARADTP
jgi:hypothetical protein